MSIKFNEDDGNTNLRVTPKRDSKNNTARKSSTKAKNFIDGEFQGLDKIWPEKQVVNTEDFENIEWTRVNKIPTLSDDNGENQLF